MLKLHKYRLYADIINILSREFGGRFKDIEEKIDIQYKGRIKELLEAIEEELTTSNDYDSIQMLKAYKGRIMDTLEE